MLKNLKESTFEGCLPNKIRAANLEVESHRQRILVMIIILCLMQVSFVVFAREDLHQAGQDEGHVRPPVLVHSVRPVLPATSPASRVSDSRDLRSGLWRSAVFLLAKSPCTRHSRPSQIMLVVHKRHAIERPPVSVEPVELQFGQSLLTGGFVWARYRADCPN